MGCKESSTTNPTNVVHKGAQTKTTTLPQHTPAASQPAAIEVRERLGQLFSFFDRRGTMQTVDGRADIPAEARAEVMVTVPGKLLDGDRIIVADLRTPQNDSVFRSWLSTRALWLDRTMPKTSQLTTPLALAPQKKRPKTARRHPKRRIPKSKRVEPPPATSPRPLAAAASATPPARRPRVIVFTTQWCPSCRRAKAFLKSKGVAFAELDVERDPRAAQAYRSVAQKHGLRGGSVPVIMVGNRVFQGFSPFQIEVALNQMAAKQ